MKPSEIELVYELSPMQQAMLFHTLVAPGSGMYVQQLSLRLSGPLDAAAFAQAWRLVAARHDVLRTAFFWEDLEKPAQVVYRQAGLEVARESWTGLPADEQRARLARYLDDDRERGFDLSAAPLMRLALFELGPARHQLVWSQHHLLVDGWSRGQLLAELFSAYAAFAAGREPLLERPRRYRDYIAWLQRQDLGLAETFWRESLAGFAAPTFAAAGEGPPAAPTWREARRRELPLPLRTTAALGAAARRHRLTLNTLVQGAWALVLSHATGRADVVFGTTVAGRPPDLEGVESILGLFINTLPVRVQVRPESRVRAWLAELQRRQVEMRRFEHAPLVEVQRWSGLPAGTALFDHLLVFENLALPGGLQDLLPELEVAAEAANTLTNYPLNLVVLPGAELTLTALYDGARFEAAAVARMLARLAALLAAFAEDRDLALGELPLLLPGERQQLLVEWNDTGSAYPREASVPELFTATAGAAPAALAVVAEEEGAGGGGEGAAAREEGRGTEGAAAREGAAWSYGRLEAASNRLAWHLRSLGVDRGARVGVAMERSADLIVALLGILKAGAVYVPLDPGYPDERLAFMLEDTGARVVLVHGRTRQRLAGLLPAATESEPAAAERAPAPTEHEPAAAGREPVASSLRPRLVCLDGDRETIAGHGTGPPSVHVAADDPAYVIYTSGSTGRPKGVVVPHRAIVRLVRETSYAQLGPDDRVAHVSNISFDAATFEIWGALLNGAAVVVIAREVVLSPSRFAARLREARVTAMFLTVALFNQVVREAPAAFAPLRHLLVGGDALDPAAIGRALREGAPRRLLNGYGPTESTTFALWHEVREVAAGALSVPIGMPLANTTAYVLDGWREPAQLGQVGELFLGGDGLAHGYLNRPELTAEVFVPHRWSIAPGERLYRTGDLARRRWDGAVEFLGRIDHQVKIRGFRVEPGEVETALAGCPGVGECVVLARRDRREGPGEAAARRDRREAPGETQLVAYVVAAAGEAPRVERLREHLKRSLPDYMLPSGWVFLESLPLTPNGKVDRAALPAPEAVERRAQGRVAPRGPIEELLAGIWAEVLGCEQVGALDDFFMLGGHSLLATQVASRVRAVFQVELPLRRLFEAPTVAELAQAIAEARPAGAALEAPPIVAAARDGELPLSFAQQRLWFLDQLEPGSHAYNLAWAFELAGRLEVPALAAALAEVVRRHEALRTRFAAAGERPVQVIAPAAPARLPVVDLGALAAPARSAEAARLVRAAARRPFDLVHGPLLRVALVRRQAEEHLALFAMHHAVSDGWSIGVLVHELGALYAAQASGRAQTAAELAQVLPPLPVQYGDYAVWQRQWLAGEVLERGLGYWRAHLAGTPGVLELPADRPRPPQQTYRGATRRLRLPRQLAADVAAFGRGLGATPFMVLLTAFGALLARYTGRDDLVVGTPIANRGRVELEPLIGFFVNTLALRLRLPGEPSFAEAVGRTREVALGAYAHQDVPFEMVVDALQPERNLARSPLFQVLFVLQNAPSAALALPGLTLAQVEADNGRAAFDLSLALVPEEAGLTALLELNLDLFDAATAHRMLGHFRQLLAAAVADPGLPLSDLSLLGEAERAQLLAEWNDTAAPYREDRCLHQLVEEQARRTPEALAVVADAPPQGEDESLTFRELNVRANRLARHLRELGVGTDTVVAICAERSCAMVVGLLAILKAGGAWLPLDPDYPRDRLRFMLDDAAAAVVLLAQSGLAGRLDAAAARTALRLDDPAAPWRDARRYPDADLAIEVDPDNLAYVIYTSGSTGTPKGTMNAHRGIVNRLLWMQESYGLAADDRLLQKTPFSFDVSVGELFWPLAAGARLVMARPEGHRDSAYLLRAIARQEITVLHFVPAMLRAFLDDLGSPGGLGTGDGGTQARAATAPRLPLRRVMASGEALSHDLQQQFYALLQAPLHNLYGPTEAAVEVTHWVCDPASERALVPIGRPLANTCIRLLDRNGCQVPIGVPAELHIGGVQLGRGYLGRPDLTAERFVPDPFAVQAGARLYRSGDVARYLADGAIEYLGRADHQVKIRGFRMELGEIEAVLAGHDEVGEAAVVAATAPSGGPRLVAFWSPRAPSPPEEAEARLRLFLAGRLPSFMIPDRFVRLPELPRTPSGKLDRRALQARAAETESARPAGRLVLPRTPAEQRLAAIWSAVLRRPHLGVHDNFFELGGDSILSLQIVARARQAGLPITPKQLFEHQTIASLAAAAEQAGAPGAEQEGLPGAEQGAVPGPLPFTPAQGARPAAEPVAGADFPLAGLDAAALARVLGSESGIVDLYPLSPLQGGLLFHTLYTPASRAFVEQLVCTLSGDLDAAALATAWRWMVERHAILRTSFRDLDRGRPVQAVHATAAARLVQEDWRGLPAPEQELQLEALARAERERGFDLALPPLMRWVLVRTGEAEHRLISSHHHLLFDGWSYATLIGELLACCEALHEGREVRLPVRRPYRDYIAWLQGRDPAAEERFWRRELAGWSGPLPLPAFAAAGAGEEPRILFCQERLSREETASLQALGRRHRLTLNTVAQAAWGLLLARYAGEAEAVFGTVVSGRPPDLPGVEEMVGLFINTVPVRVAAGGEAPLPAWLAELQARQVELRQHEHSPLVEVQRWSGAPPGVPLFESLYVFENFPIEDAVRRGPRHLQVSAVRSWSGGNGYPLTALAVPGEELLLRLEHDAARIDAATAARLLGHHRALLAAIAAALAAGGKVPLRELQLLSAAERHQLLHELAGAPGGTGPGLPEICVHQLIERQAALGPERPAVLAAQGGLTYGELDEQANRLARRLRRCGIGPEQPVGILLERSPQAVVAILAVLKAGGAYLPLDPALPAERLAAMLDDAQAAAVISDRRHWTGHDGQPPAILLDSDSASDSEAPAAEEGARLGLAASPAQLAYVIYTSGSTGRPKGVAVSHRNLLSSTLARHAFYRQPVGVFQLASALVFDSSVAGLFWTLTQGGALALPPERFQDDLPGFAASLAENRATHLLCLPSLYGLLLEEAGGGGGAGLAGLRTIIVAGESCPAELVRRHAERLPETELYNEYGPTEGTVWASAFDCRRLGDAQRVPLGWPIPNVRLHVVGSAGEPLPAGAVGEICIGGEGVARGYLHRPELAAERFVPDPFAETPGARLYRTGDRARRRLDGALEFLGRRDHQVKIRGYRIELQEIEAALAALPGVRDAVALVREAGGDRRPAGSAHREAPSGAGKLVAYVAAGPEGAPGPRELRESLRRKLPDYMVPADFHVLERLPLTATGKVDRAALLALDWAPREDGGYVAPRGAVEGLLAGIWEEVLGRERVGVHDDFLALGGHSLLATQVVSRVRRLLRVELPVRRLFEAPTVAELARVVAETAAEARPGGAAGEAPPILPVPRDGRPLPLSFAQQRLWFIDQLRPGSSAYNVPAAVRIGGPLDRAALAASLSEVVRRHEALRTRFVARAGEPEQVVEAARALPLPLVELAALPPGPRLAELGRLTVREAASPFDLARGPLLRALLVRLAGGASPDHRLLATMHHIVSDGGSMAIFRRETMALYEGRARGARPALPELPIQYADYAVWQRAWLRGEVLEGELAYWRRQLAGAPALLALPIDRPRQAVPAERGAGRRRHLPPALAEELRACGRRHGVTLFMTLLAGFAALLSRYSGELDLCVGTPVAGRDRLELEGLIGFFVNTLVLRADLAGGPGFTTLLARLRQTVLDAHLHQALPFEKLVDELAPERSLSHTPLFQAALVVDAGGAPAGVAGLPAAPALPGDAAAAAAPAAIDEVASVKFDLTLAAGEGAAGLTMELVYRRELFEAATMERMLGHLERLLAEVLAAPEAPVGAAALLDAAERHQLVTEWGAAAEDGEAAAGPGLHELFAAQAARAPAAVAVVDGTRSLTYGELHRRAVALAGELARRGVRPGELVALCLERGFETVVAILATLAAGAAYLPLDPSLPRERLAFMLRDARPRLALATAESAAHLPAGEAPVLLLDAAATLETSAGASGTPPRAAVTPPAITPAYPAYVIYTSGSTGQPKGVVICHRQVVRLFAATAPWFGFGAADVWTLFHSYAFDFSVWELWGALLHGGRLVVVPHLVSRSPEAFYELLARSAVTVLNQTPTAFRQLQQVTAARPAGEGRLALRLIVFGGEALEPELLRPWLERHGDERPRLVNMYGITETTVHVTCRRLRLGDLAAGGSPIGRPIPDLAVFVLDPRGEPAAIGMPGEIHVAGAGLGTGYLGRPELTAARFVPHALARRPGERLYRSGDRGRYRPDGEIDYLGRLDQQVKLRGFRIELGEIEAALAELPAVRDAVVRVRPGAAGEPRLVAWVVAAHAPVLDATSAHGAALAPAELRRALAARLPEYMVPAAFVPLAELPLTANGKLDATALPDPGERDGSAGAGGQLAPPRTAAELRLAAAVAAVLGVAAAGMDDNFFALGGDSISAIRLRASAAAAGLHFELQDIFRYPSLRELARAAAGAGHEAGELPPRELAPFSLLEPADRAALPPGLDDAYPLTRLQAGMVFHAEFAEQGIRPYHNVRSVHLSAPCDPAALRRALDRQARRHPVLRTRFAMAGFGEPLQLVESAVAPPLLVCDLRALTAAAQQAVVDARFAANLARRFDLGQAPLLRCELFLYAAGRFELLWAEHHAILDGWSVTTMLAEVFELYLSEMGAVPAPAPPPAGNLLRDFVALERAALAAPETRDFWHDRLAERPPARLPRWPLAAAPGTVAPARQQLLEIPVGNELADRLQELARRAGMPLKSALLATHLAALSRLCGTPDVITGLVSNGRPEVEGGDRALGLFLNTVPLRLRLGAGSWLDLVRQVFAEELELLPHRRYPLAELQRELGGQPLFETSFNFVHFHALQGIARLAPVTQLGWREVSEVHFACSASFSIDPLNGLLNLSLSIAADEFPAAQGVYIGELYLRVLTALAEHPEGDAGQAPLLTAAERHQLLIECNATAVEHGARGGRCLHELFAAQAARTPEAVAIVCSGRTLGYGELERRAGRLARRLRRLGVGPEVTVGVLMERSPELIVALLAVLAAGGAYVPLDPSLPGERLEWMARDAGVAVLLVREGSGAALPGLAGARVEVSESGAGEGERDAGGTRGAGSRRMEERRPEERRADDRHRGGATAGNLAYVLYTSGSTGRPKGVAVSHGAIVNHMLWMQAAYPLAPHDCVLQRTSIGFDASVWEIYAPLLAGAALALPPPAAQRDPAVLAEQVAVCGATVLQVVPSLLEALLDEPRFPGGARLLRRVFCGGEALAPALARRFAARCAASLINLYGPTEATIDATAHLCAPAGEPVTPIGRPIDNTRLYVAGELRPAPLGAPGELWIGGACLARGYFGHPELTAARFLPDPFGGEPGARLYRTGDLARRLPGGELEYLGRVDRQVKLRGFRIELGEIEAALEALPEVRNAVVRLRPGAGGEARLVAYVVAVPGTDLAPADLRRSLVARLPEYMLPAAFVPLAQLPLTANGKLDAAALPDPGEPGRGAGRWLEAPPVAPRDAVELELARMWEDLLGVSPVGVGESFFELGGHSLTAVRLMARIRARFGNELPLGALFQRPTVEGIAELLRRGGAREEAPSSPPAIVQIEKGGAGRPFFCVHPVGGAVLCYADLARQLAADRPFFGLQAEAGGEAAEAVTVPAMAARYLTAVRGAQPAGPYLLGGWSMGGLVALDMARQLAAQGEEVALLALIDPTPPATARQDGKLGGPRGADGPRGPDGPGGPDGTAGLGGAAIAWQFASDLAGLLGANPADLAAVYAQTRPAGEELADAAAVVQRMFARLRAARLLPPDLELADLERRLRVFERNLMAAAAYLPLPYGGPMALFIAEERGVASADPTPAWRSLAAGGLAVHSFAGDHYALLRRPRVADLAAALRETLDRADARSREGVPCAPGVRCG
jgi:amino acid adenylation domain-containing protein